MKDTPIVGTPTLRRRSTEPLSTDDGFTMPQQQSDLSSFNRPRPKGARGGRHPLVVALVALGIAALVGFFVTLAVFSAHAADKKQAGSVAFLEGDATVTRGSGGSALAVGSALYDGDRLKTAQGAKLEAKLTDGSLMRLAPGSELKLEEAKFAKGDSGTKKVKISLTFGRVWASVTKLFGTDSSFQVATENAVAGVRGTRFAAEKSATGDTTVRVYSGQVLVSNAPIYAKAGHTKAKRVQVPGPSEVSQKQWTELVAGAMQQVRVTKAGEMSPVESFAMAGDDWAAWNAERDRAAGIVE
ncbi:MAG TPA: FecR family protein [Myxococcota bacterium]|nr:FecR family protein [Myxococcota bacterium]